MLRTRSLQSRRHFSFLLLGAGLLAVCPAHSAPPGTGQPSPEGLWTTVDDDGKTPKSVVELRVKGGKLEGRVIELINPSKKDPTCDDCEGARKGQKIVGMTILWDMTLHGDRWEGGTILDPKNGKTYRCHIKVIDGGQRLEVRGFIGISLLGRTQYWQRKTS